MDEENVKSAVVNWMKNLTSGERIIYFSLFLANFLFLIVDLLLKCKGIYKKRKTRIESEILAEKLTKSCILPNESSGNSSTQNSDNTTRPRRLPRLGAFIHNKSVAKWWQNYKLSNIVSLDCEFVHLRNGSGDSRIKLATVVIYDYLDNILYEGKVYHHPESFIVDIFTRSINGSEKDSFLDGQSLKEVQDEVKDILLYDKLVIVFGGRLDFLCLDIDSSEIDVFELQDVYYSTFESKRKGTIRENHSLRSVYFHYFNRDIDETIHSAVTDAEAIMSIFKYGYKKDYKNGHKNCPEGLSSNDIERI